MLGCYCSLSAPQVLLGKWVNSSTFSQTVCRPRNFASVAASTAAAATLRTLTGAFAASDATGRRLMIADAGAMIGHRGTGSLPT